MRQTGNFETLRDSLRNGIKFEGIRNDKLTNFQTKGHFNLDLSVKELLNYGESLLFIESEGQLPITIILLFYLTDNNFIVSQAHFSIVSNRQVAVIAKGEHNKRLIFMYIPGPTHMLVTV